MKKPSRGLPIRGNPQFGLRIVKSKKGKGSYKRVRSQKIRTFFLDIKNYIF